MARSCCATTWWRASAKKPPGDNALINGGFFVLHPDVLDRIEGDDTPWETEPLESLARDGELCAYRHAGFWQPMDTLRDKTTLETLWESGSPPGRCGRTDRERRARGGVVA